jgi:hypothetical protein
MAGILQTRYSFTAQFIRGSALFATQARTLEDTNRESAAEAVVAEHRAFVVGAIVQCAAALEAEIAEVVRHGPGHQLGSDGIDAVARAFLEPLCDVIEGESTLRQYEVVLHLLKRPALDRGTSPYQPAAVLIRLRNELIHYKSKWGPEMESEKLFTALQQLRFEKPPFESPNTNFFPHRCLSASLASWGVTSTIAFIEDFYSRLGIQSPLKPYMERLAVPPVFRIDAV